MFDDFDDVCPEDTTIYESFKYEKIIISKDIFAYSYCNGCYLQYYMNINGVEGVISKAYFISLKNCDEYIVKNGIGYKIMYPDYSTDTIWC